MRELIIDRIIEISEANDRFHPALMRWRERKFKGILLSDLQIGSTEYMNQFSDKELLTLFEKIVIIAGKLM
jgi:predicted house-cleaning noncanonical NTP pyrophosphatase (MazG superfamily)